MGGRSSGGSRNTSTEFQYEEPALEAGKPTRYAREIFDKNYAKARNLAKEWGTEQPFAMSNLYWSDYQEVMKTQTLKGVQSLINSEKENIKLDIEFGVLSPEDARRHMAALNAVQKTLNEQWRRR